VLSQKSPPLKVEELAILTVTLLHLRAGMTHIAINKVELEILCRRPRSQLSNEKYIHLNYNAYI